MDTPPEGRHESRSPLRVEQSIRPSSPTTRPTVYKVVRLRIPRLNRCATCHINDHRSMAHMVEPPEYPGKVPEIYKELGGR